MAGSRTFNIVPRAEAVPIVAFFTKYSTNGHHSNSSILKGYPAID